MTGPMTLLMSWPDSILREGPLCLCRETDNRKLWYYGDIIHEEAPGALYLGTIHHMPFACIRDSQLCV